MLITELEIGAIGIDFFDKDVMVGTRTPEKGQNIEINEKR
jgi:hypothetical protein